MANKAISELPQALNVNNQDLFVLEQSGITKKLTAETFITEQGIIDALAEALDGHGGISSVTLSSVSGRIRTYLITFTDETSTTFQVLDGTSIDRITKTSTAGLTDTYTVFMSDGTTTFFTVTNGADGTVSEAMLNDALKDKAPAITETTESSTIANFTDGADDLVMHNIVAEINPVQSGSGDPSPDNIRPISGWTGCNVTRVGKNLLDPDKWTINPNVPMTISDGTITLSNSGYQESNNKYITYNSTYTLSFHVKTIALNNSSASFATYFDGVKTVGKTGTGGQGNIYLTSVGNEIDVVYTITGKGEVSFGGWAYQGTVEISNIQLELGSTATAYESYQDSSVSVDWSTEAGTVYGGTIDVATGLLTVGWKTHIFNGSERWDFWNNVFVNYDLTDIVNPTSVSQDTVIIADRFKPNGVTYRAGCGDGNIIKVVSASAQIACYSSTYTDIDAFKASLVSNPMTVCYKLATPQTYQLTGQQLKTLLGTNNVWADTGNVSVTYPADTKMFIEKLTMPTEDDLVANQAITSGKFFMVGNNLYIATAAIASGAKIIEGTNATRLSLADALNRL